MPQVLLLRIPSNLNQIRVFLPIRPLATISQMLHEYKIDNVIYDFGNLATYKQYYYFTQNKFSNKNNPIYKFLDSFFSKRVNSTQGEEKYLEWVLLSIEINQNTRCILFWIENREDLKLARKVASRIRKNHSGSNITFVGLGDYIKFAGPYILPYIPEFDCLILNHWETSIVSLYKSLEFSKNLSTVPNSAFIVGNTISLGPHQSILTLDDLPIPTYDSYHVIFENEKIKVFTIESSRDGFVTYAEPKSLRPKICSTSARMLQEIAFLRKKFNSLCFHISGETSTSSEVQLFAMNLIKAPFYIYYTRELNCLEIEGDLVPTLSLSGGKGIEVKLPTGSQRLLSNFYGIMRTISSLEGALSAFSSSQIYTSINCSYPSPEDDRHTFAETLRLVQRVKPDMVKVSPVWLWPDSTWWENRIALGFNVDTDDYLKWLSGENSNFNYLSWRPYPQNLLEQEIAKLKIHCGGDVIFALINELLQISKSQKGFRQVLQEALSASEPEVLEDIIVQFNRWMSKKISEEEWTARRTGNYRAVAN